MLFSSIGVANIVKKDVATKPQATTGALSEYASHWSQQNSRTLLWDNGLPDGVNGLICGEMQAYGYHAEIIDDVQPDYDWTVGSAEFFFLNQFQTADVSAINVRVYADNGAGVPSTTLLYSAQADYTCTWTGNMPWGYYEQDCVCSFPGISMPAGAKYWIEFQPVSTYLDYWETSVGWGSPLYGAWPEVGYYQWVTSSYEFGADYNVNFALYMAADHDVIVKSIDAPVTGTAYAPITPTTTIQNGGANDENVDVHMTIQSMSSGSSIYSEDFTGCTSLADAGFTTNYPANWAIEYGSTAGGVSPEIWFYYYPNTIDTARCISPIIDTTGVTNANLAFKQMINDYNGVYDLAVETTTDGGATWNTVWTIPGQWMDPTTTTIALDSSCGLGSSTFQIAFTFIGDFYNINYWFIDDINLGTAGGIITEVDQTVNIDIASGATQVVTYDAWTPAAWHNVDGANVQYTVNVEAPLATDEVPGNNYKTTTPTLWYPYYADVAMDAYLSPVGGMGGVYAPQAQITNYGQFAQTFPATVQIGSPYNIDYYFNDLELDNAGFYTNGTEWQYGAGTGMCPAAYSGMNEWGINTVSGGGYPNGDSQFMWTPVYYDIPANLKLTFQTYLYSEGYYDGYNVKVSTDYGATWTLLGSYGNPYNYATLYGLGEPGLGGTYGYWMPVTFDLGAYAGMDIMLQFHFGSDSSVTYTGDYIDDIHAYAIGVAAEYSQTIDVTLQPGETQVVNFPAWTPSAYETVDNTYIDYIANGYTALPGDEYTLNDACQNVPFSLWFPYRWDVAPTSIISPWDNIPGATLPVQFTIGNLGSHPCNDFPVYCTITGPNGIQFSASTYTSLAFQESQYFDFGTWTPEEMTNGAQGWIQYTMTVTTAYPGDINTANDVMTHVFYLFYPYLQDVGVVSINSPVGDGIGEPKAVDVTVGAFGVTNPPAFSTNVQIGTSYIIDTVYSEDFTGDYALPDGWGTDYPSNWMMDTYGNYAGGVAPELYMNWYPEAIGDVRCWTGEIDTSGTGAGLLTFKFSTNDFDSAYNLAVETSTDGVTWHQVWTVPGGAYTAETVQIPLGGADGFGSPTFRVAFTFIGDTWDINDWYVDDISIVSLGVIAEYDQTISGISLNVGETQDLAFPTWIPAAYTANQNGDIQYLCLAHTICAGDYDTGNDVAGSLFTLHYANDVQVKSITDPHLLSNGRAGTYYMQPGTIPVAGIVKNVGTYDESGMTASATIGTIYDHSIAGIALTIGEEEPITFPDATLDTEGTYTLTMSLPLGTDANPGDNVKTLTIGVDDSAPTTSYTLSPSSPNGNAGWYVSSVKVTLSATDAMSGVKDIKYKIDDGSWTTYSKAFWVNASGQHTIYYKSTDKVGNEETEKSFTLWVDKEVPTIVLSKQILLNRIKFTATCNDTVSGLDRVEFYLIDPYGNATLVFNDTDGTDGWSCTLHPIPQGGNYSIYAYVYDIAGNMAYTNSTSQPAPDQQGYGGNTQQFVQQPYSMKP